MVVDYQLNKDSQAVSLRIFPAALEESIVPHREKLEGRDIPAWYFEPLVQFRLQGDLDDLCARLVRMQLRAAEAAPSSEIDLPVICNEWCTSWGDPRHENLVAMADQLQGSGVKYLVIDAGWYKGDAGNAAEAGHVTAARQPSR
jgi:alpha-galactosidase